MAHVFLLQRSFQNYILAFYKYTTFDINSPSLDRENCSKSDQPIIYKIKDFLWYVFFYFELHSKLDWGGFFSIFIVSMMTDDIFKMLFLPRRSRDFSWRNNTNNDNNLLLNLICVINATRQCVPDNLFTPNLIIFGRSHLFRSIDYYTSNYLSLG